MYKNIFFQTLLLAELCDIPVPVPVHVLSFNFTLSILFTITAW